MAYVKQHTITNGQPAQAVQVTENFEDVKRYIDRGIIQADLSNASVDAPEIVRGEINAYTRDHQFTCGDGYGIFLDSNTRNIQPMTNLTKSEYLPYWTNQANSASAPGDSHPISILNTVPHTFKKIELPRRALVTYRCLLFVYINKNKCVDADDNSIIPEHRYTTYLYLTNDNTAASAATTTKGRFFDECAFSNSWAGGPSSWAGPVDQDPMRDGGAGDGYANNIKDWNYRRKYQVTKTWDLNAGTYCFGVMSDVHHDNGYTSPHNITIEVEYVGSNIT